MKRIMFMLALSAALVAGADISSDVLVWYLDLGDSPDPDAKGATFDSLNFYLRSTEGGANILLNSYTYTDPDNMTGAGSLPKGGIEDGNFAGAYYTDLSGAGDISWNQYEFMMTLWSGGTLVAWSETLFNWNADPVTYEDLKTAQAMYARSQSGDLNPGTVPSGVVAYNFGPNVVPEPTGGILMLLGGSLLALRRRRRA